MTLKLEADFLLDNHRLPREGVPTPGLFLPQEKNQVSIIHLVSLHPPFLTLLQERQKKSPGESLSWMELNWGEQVHPHSCPCEMWSLFFRLQPPSAELSTDQLANTFCFSTCPLFCLISQSVQKPSQEKAGLFLAFLKDPQLTTHTKHLAEYLDAQSIFIE